MEVDSYFVLVRSGSGSFNINGEEFPVQAGCVAWIQCSQVLTICPEFGETLTLWVAAFDYQLLSYYMFNQITNLREVEIVTGLPVIGPEGDDVRQIARQFEQFRHLSAKNSCGSAVIRSSFLRKIELLYNRAAARRIAAESFVLLKNDSIGLHPGSLPQPLLPLKKEGTIAVIGPLGNTRSNMPGTWSVAARLNDYPSLYEGLKEMMSGKVNVTYAKGSNLIGDAAYEERATMFGRSLNRDNRTDKELLDEALKTAAGADVIIAALGESSEMSGESSSRTNLDLPDVQRSLLEALLKTGKPVVLTLFTGRPLTLTGAQANVPAILNVWFGGSEAAYAIGDVLFGDVNPSGKLTMTFPKNVGQIPLFYNHKNTGRPLQAGKWFEKFRSNYLDVSNDPLYPFGYGLSYTTFQYSDITLSSKQLNADGKLTASVTVTNTGNYDADEIVQLYIRDLVGSITRPMKELKGFERIHLKKGESKQVTFTITPELLKFYNYDIQYVYEPGEFHVMIGPNSRDVKTTSFELK